MVRETAFVRCPVSETRRLMVCTVEGETYLFGYDTLQDATARWDEWFATPEAAKTAAHEGYGVEVTDWQPIAAALPGCQHDWIAPVRVVGRAAGQPQWGQLEKLTDGQWQPFHPIS